jgi:transcriptional regulator with XRE-family HTH domain
METTVNQRIKTLRIELGKSQEEFAQELGVTQTAIFKLENKGGLSSKMLKKITESYKINPSWLLEGVGEKYSQRILKMENSNSFMDNLKVAFGKLEGYVIGKYGKEEWSNIQEFFPPNFKVAYPFIQKAS